MKAWQRSGLEGRRDAVALELVVARRDPGLAVQRHPNLRRAQHVARGMKRNLDPVAGQDFAVSRSLDRDVAEALAQNRGRVAMADVDFRAEAGVVGMGMGDDGARNRPPGIDVKVARGAIEAAVGRNDKVQDRSALGDDGRDRPIWGSSDANQLDLFGSRRRPGDRRKQLRLVAVRRTELRHVTILFVRHRIFLLALLAFFAQHHDDHLRE